MTDLPGTDLQERGGKNVLINEIPSHFPNLDAVANRIGLGTSANDRTTDAEDEFLSGNYQGNCQSDERNRQGPQFLRPNESQSQQEDKNRSIPDIDDPPAPQVRGLVLKS